MDRTKNYIERINKVIDYIEINIKYKINLEELAQLACLSKYHFHRIFYSFTEEPLYEFINRLRLERAAALLVTGKMSITDIAFNCGFNDSSTFSRAFKKNFNVSAREWKKNKNSKIDQDHREHSSYILDTNVRKEYLIRELSVTEKNINKTCFAYIRHTGTYSADYGLFLKLHKKLMQWAAPLGIMDNPETEEIVIYHDPKGITHEEKLRISMGVSVPDSIHVSGEIGKLNITEGKYLICKFELGNKDYGKAWTHVYRNILPAHGFQPNDGYSFEKYSTNCYDKEKKTTTVNICIPVKIL